MKNPQEITVYPLAEDEEEYVEYEMDLEEEFDDSLKESTLTPDEKTKFCKKFDRKMSHADC